MEALTEAVRVGQGAQHRVQRVGPATIQAALDLPGRREVRLEPAAVLRAVASARGEGRPAVRANGISQIVWSPLAQGVLTGKYPPGSRPRRLPRREPEHGRDHRELPQRRGADGGPAPQAHRRRGRDHDGAALAGLGAGAANVAAAIVGATRPQQVRENAAARDVNFTKDTLAAIDDALRTAAGVVSSETFTQPPSGAAVACQSSSKPSSGAGSHEPPRDVAQPRGGRTSGRARLVAAPRPPRGRPRRGRPITLKPCLARLRHVARRRSAAVGFGVVDHERHPACPGTSAGTRPPARVCAAGPSDTRAWLSRKRSRYSVVFPEP